MIGLEHIIKSAMDEEDGISMFMKMFTGIRKGVDTDMKKRADPFSSLK